MATSEDKRLSDLEQATGGGDDQIRVSVNWENDDLVLDRDAGERVTEDEWRRRHPKDRLIIVRWEDFDDS